MRDGKIGSFHGHVNGKQGGVGTVPELVMRGRVRQISLLSPAHHASGKHGNQKKPFFVSHAARLSVMECGSEMTYVMLDHFLPGVGDECQ